MAKVDKILAKKGKIGAKFVGCLATQGLAEVCSLPWAPTPPLLCNSAMHSNILQNSAMHCNFLKFPAN